MRKKRSVPAHQQLELRRCLSATFLNDSFDVEYANEYSDFGTIEPAEFGAQSDPAEYLLFPELPPSETFDTPDGFYESGMSSFEAQSTADYDSSMDEFFAFEENFHDLEMAEYDPYAMTDYLPTDSFHDPFDQPYDHSGDPYHGHWEPGFGIEPDWHADPGTMSFGNPEPTIESANDFWDAGATEFAVPQYEVYKVLVLQVVPLETNYFDPVVDPAVEPLNSWTPSRYEITKRDPSPRTKVAKSDADSSETVVHRFEQQAAEGSPLNEAVIPVRDPASLDANVRDAKSNSDAATRQNEIETKTEPANLSNTTDSVESNYRPDLERTNDWAAELMDDDLREFTGQSFEAETEVATLVMVPDNHLLERLGASVVVSLEKNLDLPSDLILAGYSTLSAASPVSVQANLVSDAGTTLDTTELTPDVATLARVLALASNGNESTSSLRQNLKGAGVIIGAAGGLAYIVHRRRSKRAPSIESEIHQSSLDDHADNSGQ